MSTLRWLLITGLLSILGNLMVFNSVFAIENYQSGQVVFNDDFNDGNYNGWVDETGKGGWLVSSGNLVGYKFGKLISGRLTNNSGSWDNYSIEVDIKNKDGIDEGIAFRRADANNSYEVNLRHGTGAYNTPEIILRKVQDGVVTDLKSTHSITLNNETWYHLKIDVVLDHIQIWLDNNLVFEVDDTATTVKKGAISLSYWTGDTGAINVRFDNVKVTLLSKQYYPVIFIPGIGGSELKANQDIIWSQSDGHGGTYSHGYTLDEKIWVNQDEAVKLGEDDYFDVLRLKEDGETSEADIGLTGNLTSFGYPDIDSFFQNIGYTKNLNYFIYPYDWRKDIATTKDDLDKLIDQVKQKSGQPKVNIVAHSMGGLVARYYIADSSRATKVHKLIELGVPHLGSVQSLKTLMYGVSLGKPIFSIFNIGITSNEVKDVYQNLPTAFQLSPSQMFYNFYDNSTVNKPYPFNDHRDIDTNDKNGPLDFTQTKNLLENLSYNKTNLQLAEKFHDFLDPMLNQSNNVKLHNVIGSGQPTLGQIKEGWLIEWPINTIEYYFEQYINGDSTVPLYSASLKNELLDLTGGAKLYYVEQTHTDLVNSNGAAMQLVKVILQEGDSIPVNVHSEKIVLEGQHFSTDQDVDISLEDDSGNITGINEKGELENNISDTFIDTLGHTTHIFIKKKAPKVKIKVSAPKKTSKSKKQKTNLKINLYKQDQITKTTYYKDLTFLSDSPILFNVNPTEELAPTITIDNQIITPTFEATDDLITDSTPPITSYEIIGNKESNDRYLSEATLSLASTDNGTGVLKTEYSLDDGQTSQTYTSPIKISTPGIYNIYTTSTDKLGNQELPKTITFTIIKPSPTLTPSPTQAPDSIVTTSESNRDNQQNSDSEIQYQAMNSTTLIGTLPDRVVQTSLASIIPISNILGISKANVVVNPENTVSRESDISTQKSTLQPNTSYISQPSLKNIVLLIVLPGLLVGSLAPGLTILSNLLTRVTISKPSNKKVDYPKPKKHVKEVAR